MFPSIRSLRLERYLTLHLWKSWFAFYHWVVGFFSQWVTLEVTLEVAVICFRGKPIGLLCAAVGQGQRLWLPCSFLVNKKQNITGIAVWHHESLPESSVLALEDASHTIPAPGTLCVLCSMTSTETA